MAHTFPIADKFISINGEGTRAGELAVFIRFHGCNLSCSYCDTRWVNLPDTPTEGMTTDAIVQYVQQTGILNITLTGGEPLLQPHIEELIDALGALGFRVEIETNGSIDLTTFAKLPHRPIFTMDYKLPSSGMELQMNTDNFRLLQARDTVKFVVGTQEDLRRAHTVIRENSLTARCSVYLSPVFNQMEPADIADYMKKNRLNSVRLQLQLHKIIWDPSEKSV